MKNAATRGQPRALAEIDTMILGRAPHAVILLGPGSVGKTTLALDLAAGLLCRDPDPGSRPCRVCRGCRLVASGNHPDLHRLAPEGPGGQVRIGKANDPEPGTVRHLIGALALLPVESGARVAIVEQAHRLNDDAQQAFLKMLEEPPAGVTIILCADDEECLLPTVRSRCVRVRLGSVGGREIERWLGELGVADAPRAARLARLAEGRPGLALAYARSADAERLRGEIARGILDLLAAGRQVRLATVRELMKSAAALERALNETRRVTARDEAGAATGPVRGQARGRKGRVARNAATDTTDEVSADGASADGASADGPGADGASADGASADGAAPKLGAADRRAAAATLVGIWASVGRDLAVAQVGGARRIRELDLIDDIRGLGPGVSAGTLSAFLARLAAIDIQLDDNVNPELALDVVALSWPRVEATTASAAMTAAPGSR
jgi:DNA polymerase-3 subunit delta'